MQSISFYAQPKLENIHSIQLHRSDDLVSFLRELKMNRKREKDNRRDKNSLTFSQICNECFPKSVVAKKGCRGELG